MRHALFARTSRRHHLPEPRHHSRLRRALYPAEHWGTRLVRRMTRRAAPAAGATSTTGTLPYTGYDGGLAVLLGGGLVLTGGVLRIRSRRP